MLSLENPIAIIAIFITMAMLPFAMLGLTSFVKLSVVFGLLRNALGAQQVPSVAITTLLSLALTIHIMMPVGEAIVSAVGPVVTTAQTSKKQDTLEFMVQLFQASAPPVTAFLQKHSRDEVRVFFASSAQQKNIEPLAKLECGGDAASPCRPEGESLLSLVPAFVISELREAFTIGVFIFLPFLVVDLVVANILVGMGMMMVSPVTISMPLKIMLFVLCDGWLILCQSLIVAYR